MENKGVAQSIEIAPIAQKLTLIRSIAWNEVGLHNALRSLTISINEEAKANLSTYAEEEKLKIYEDLLQTYEKVNELLSPVDKEIEAMKIMCDVMAQQLQRAKLNTSNLVEQTQILKKEALKCEQIEHISNEFIHRFVLSSKETYNLSSPIAVNDDFFKAFHHMGQIERDLHFLSKPQDTKLAREVAEFIASYRIVALTKLVNFIRIECRIFAKDTPEITPSLKFGLFVLKEKKDAFKQCLEEIGNMRKISISRMFIDAMTQGSGMNRRPIDLYSHDTVRYIGDMLAWLHQTAASEKELYSQLFDLPFLNDTGLSNMDQMNIGNSSQYMAETELMAIIDRGFDGTCLPLKMRAEQALIREQNSVATFKLTSLIQFYCSTIAKILGHDSSLIRTIEELRNSAQKLLSDVLTSQMERLLNAPMKMSVELQPTDAYKSLLIELNYILSASSASLTLAADREQEIEDLMKLIIDPCIKLSAQTAANLSSVKSLIFQANCLYYIKETLLPYPILSKKLHEIVRELDEKVDKLVKEKFSMLMNACGLADIYKAWNQQNGTLPLSRCPGLDPLSLLQAMSAFGNFLSAGIDKDYENLRYLLDVSIAETIRERVKSLVLTFYKDLHDIVHDPKNKYESPRDIMPLSYEQIKTLFSL